MQLGEGNIFLSDDKIFYTVEGEGEFVGYPSVFMRLSMCNLTCKGFASATAPPSLAEITCFSFGALSDI